jgi:hypothetical protein
MSNEIIAIQSIEDNEGGQWSALEASERTPVIKEADGIVGQLLQASDDLELAKTKYDELCGMIKFSMKKYGVSSFKLANGRSICFVKATRKSVDNGKAIQFLSDNGILNQYQCLDADKYKKDFPETPAIKATVSEFIRINEWKK